MIFSTVSYVSPVESQSPTITKLKLEDTSAVRWVDVLNVLELTSYNSDKYTSFFVFSIWLLLYYFAKYYLFLNVHYGIMAMEILIVNKTWRRNIL